MIKPSEPDKPPESASSVKITEEFQNEITPMIQQATIPELDFISSLCSERRQELMKGGKPKTFDMSQSDE